jgi:hypothetical protein
LKKITLANNWKQTLPHDDTAGTSVEGYAAMTISVGQNLIQEYVAHALELRGGAERKQLFSEI